MDLHCLLSIWKQNVVLILIFFCGKSNSFELYDLRIICLYAFPFDIEDNSYESIIPLDNFCTSIATFWNLELQHPPNGMSMPKFKGALPYVFIYNRYFYEDTKNMIRPDKVKSYLDELNRLISINGVDVVVIDFFFHGNDEPEIYDENFQKDLTSLCDNLRKTHKDMIIGLKVHRNVDVVKSVINLSKVDRAFNFYLIASYWYKKCRYEKNPFLMATPPTPDEMHKSINDLKNIGFKSNKLFLNINVVVTSFKDSDDQHPELWSYGWTCQAKPGNDRRLCRGTLDNIYRQSKVAFYQNLAGVLIEAVDCDDYDNICGCTIWPAIQCIRDGVQGRNRNNFLLACKNFGLLPKERS